MAADPAGPQRGRHADQRQKMFRRMLITSERTRQVASGM
jgi:hypothetical protein